MIWDKSGTNEKNEKVQMSRKLLKEVVMPPGFEPGTYCLEGHFRSFSLPLKTHSQSEKRKSKSSSFQSFLKLSGTNLGQGLSSSSDCPATRPPELINTVPQFQSA